MVARVSARGDLPEAFAAGLLAPDHDGALSILLEASDRPGRGLAPDAPRPARRGALSRAPSGWLAPAPRSRCSSPCVTIPSSPPGCWPGTSVLEALVAGPRRPRLDRALVRVLEAVAPVRSPLRSRPSYAASAAADVATRPARSWGGRPPARVLRRPRRPGARRGRLDAARRSRPGRLAAAAARGPDPAEPAVHPLRRARPRAGCWWP